MGTGHIHQGRYKSFPVQADGHFLTVCRYVERNAMRAGLVEQAEDWPWCSLWRRRQSAEQSALLLPADRWPVVPPRNWVTAVNRAQTGAELEAPRRSVVRGRPFGGLTWTGRMVRRLGLENTLRPRGRPRKPAKKRPTD